VPRFLTPEWVDAFNEAVADLEVAAVDTGASLAADGGSFRVAQVVRGGPAGELVVTLVAAGGRLRLELGPGSGSGSGSDQRAEPQPGPSAPQPDVVVSLSYEDAAAMSSGRLDPAAAVAEGRVRVRGDLALLVAAQSLLASAAGRLTVLQGDTTY
jgi:hypothetical protein